MKKFLIRIIAFFSILLVFLIGSVYLVKYHANFRIDNDKKIIVVGHSHPECAFNDSLISGLSNFSSSGESYFYTYYKTKKLIEQNPQLKIILIEFTNNQVSQIMDSWTWEEPNFSHFFPKYALFIDHTGYNLLYKENSEGIERNIIPTLKNNFKVIAKGLKYTNEVGGYLALEHVMSATERNKEEEQKDVKLLNKISDINIKYLKMLVDQCKKNGIKVFFVRSPLYREYYGFSNEELFQKILASKFPDIELLDFSKFPLQDSDFADTEHLNSKGAKVFSIWIQNLIKSGLFKRSDKKLFIEDEIENYKNIVLRKDIKNSYSNSITHFVCKE